jgi:hypothetical protein
MKELKDMNVTEIKALLYDSVVELQRVQNNISILNKELEERNKPKPVEAELVKD